MASKAYMLVRARTKPIVLIAALVVMVAAVLYAMLNRSHEVSPAAPMHQAR